MIVLLSILFLLTMLWLFWSLIGLIYPMRPFATRRRAARSSGVALVASFAVAVAVGVLVETGKPPSRAVVSSGGSESAEAETQPATGSEIATAEPCRVDDGVYAVSGDHDLRTGPAQDADRIKNEKASAILGKTHYHQIDGSTTVRRLCSAGEWSEVQVVAPEWLTHVRGWVASSALRTIERTPDGERLFVEDDFYWDDDTSKFKKPIITVVNRIARENKSCGVIDPSSVAKSSSRSKPGDPVFFVTCGEGADVFNVWFRPGDAPKEAEFAATVPLGRAEAASACERAAREAAVHPSTVDFSRFLDLAYVPHASGRARVVSSFTAKNSFGLELKYTIDCLFEGAAMIETVILEAAD